MKILTDFKTIVQGDSVTITCKIIESGVPSPMMQNTVLHMDDKNIRHITHIQMSNHGFFVRVPQTAIGVAIPNEQWVTGVARVVEPKLNLPKKV